MTRKYVKSGIYAVQICPQCRREFYPTQGLPKSGGPRFCSHKCRTLGATAAGKVDLALALSLWRAGKTTGQIGAQFGVSRNVIIGLAHRNDFPPHPSLHQNAHG